MRLLSAFTFFIVTIFSPVASSIEGNAEAGKAKAQICASCHGVDGNSAIGQFPNIAGQPLGYIQSQLESYKNSSRENAIMSAQVQNLTAQDMADLDAYFSSQPAKINSISEQQAATALKAESIYRNGFAKYDIPACISCHGPSGAGIPPNFPRIGGQHASYTAMQLRAFKSGDRKNEIMQSIAFPLSEEQIEQLALYISALQ